MRNVSSAVTVKGATRCLKIDVASPLDKSDPGTGQMNGLNATHDVIFNKNKCCENNLKDFVTVNQKKKSQIDSKCPS